MGCSEDNFAQTRTLRDLEERARERLPRMVYDYYAGGAGDEVTLRENETAWKGVRLRPRVLMDVKVCDPRTTVLGQPIAMPVLTAPCALNTLAHPEGECAVARAAAAAGVIQIVSTMSSYSLEEVAQACEAPRWFQLYCYRDRNITKELTSRAEAAGFLGLCLTVDAPVSGVRDRDERNRFRIPPEVRIANLAHLIPDSDEGSALFKYVNDQFDRSVTWEALDWLRSLTRLPIVVKGVLAPEDARLAVEHGAAGIVVSNHGGRQLDGTIATCHALPEVVAAVVAAGAAGAVEVFVDGGLRRGTDVLKAIALGARAVLVGRPYLWGLAADGERGVRRVLDLLRDELCTAMAIAGCPTIAKVHSGLLAP